MRAQGPALAALTVFLVACGGSGGPAAAPAVAAFTLSGTISVSADTLVDSDVNDPLGRWLSNDEPATAQEVTGSATIGGYVNVAGAGEPGRSYEAGDRSDFYRVTVGANQVISLLVADPDSGDVDLYLWDATGSTILAGSIGTQGLETLTIAEAGTYLIEVLAWSGASNYVLAIGQTAGPASDVLNTQQEMASGQAIVRIAPAGLALANGGFDDLASRHGLTRRAGVPAREVLVTLPPDLVLVPQAAGVGVGLSEIARRRALFAEPAAAARFATLCTVKALQREPTVEHAEPNFIRRLHLTPNDPYYGLQWHYPQINLPLAWDITTGSPAVVVGVVDSGILLSHPEFQGRLVPGYDFISNAARSDDGDGIDPDPSDPGYSGGLSRFHGTHVAGTVAAAGNNAVGVAGIGWSLRIMPLRAVNEAGGTAYDIRQAIRFAAGLPNDSGTVPAQPADVINLSLGGSGFSFLDQQTITEARQRGVVIVAAAGNESSAVPSYPAAYEGVVSVGAVGIRKTLASYSNFGPTVDLTAPGGDYGDFNGDGWFDGVWSTCGDDSAGTIVPVYCLSMGTSMAAPHVAGVIALMRSLNAGLGPTQIDALIGSGGMTEDLGVAGRDDQFGYGLIEARKAITIAASGSIPTAEPAIYVSPESLNFGAHGTLLNLYLRSSGAAGVRLLETRTSAPWLVVGPTASVVDGFGQYAVTVTRAGLSPGPYSGYVEFISSANALRVPVLMEVSAASRTGDAGLHYVLLVDTASGEVIAQREVSASDGAYAFRFTGVTAGRYQVLAGSDADNDGLICDPGEACGAYLTLDQPIAIEVAGDRPGVDFSSGFDVTIRQTGFLSGSLTGVPARRKLQPQSDAPVKSVWRD